MQHKPKIGIIGSGRLGTALARQFLKAGYEVRIANSRGPESLELLLSVLLPGAIATIVDEAIVKSDIIILAIPSHQYTSLDPAAFNDKVVIDAMNYWSPTEGVIPEFINETGGTSEFIQTYLPTAKVVKSLNHVAYNELEAHNLPKGDPKRRAIAIAGDDAAAKLQVVDLIDAIGFDAVDLGGIAAGQKFQPDTPLFNARYTADQLRTHA